MLSFCTSSIAWYQSKLWRKKKLQKFARCLATFKDITLHAVKCKALKFTRLMLKKKKKRVVFYVVSWEGDHYCHVGPKKKKKQRHTNAHIHRRTDTHTHTHTHTHLRSNSHQWSSSLYISSEKIFWFLGTVRSVKMWNKQTWKCYSVHWLLVFLLFEDIRHHFLLQTGWTSCNLSHNVLSYFNVTAWKPRSNLWMYPFTLFIIIFLLNVISL